MTCSEDAIAAVALGADAIGLVFYDKSPRTVTLEQAQEICSRLPPFIATVGLFVNAEPSYIDFILSHIPLSVLQFHGDEVEVDCKRYALPYIKAVRMQEDLQVDEIVKQYPSATAILFDTYQLGIPGGTGKVFDWKLLPNMTKPVILAGGLNASNVSTAIRTCKPYAVDVSSGIEISPGVKDIQKMTAFIQKVIDCNLY